MNPYCKLVESFLEKRIDADRTALFDLDGTLVDGDLGETVFFSILLSRLLSIDPRDIQALGTQLKQKRKHPVLLHRSEVGEVLREYFALLGENRYADAYRLTDIYLTPFYGIITDRYCHEILEVFHEPLTVPLLMSGTGSASASSDIRHIRLHAAPDPWMMEILDLCIASLPQIYIVSASPEHIVKVFIGMFCGTSVSGIGTCDQKGAVPYGYGKVKALEHHDIRCPFLAFGNSVGDSEMLALARYAFVRIDGVDSAMVRLGRERGWHILEKA